MIQIDFNTGSSLNVMNALANLGVLQLGNTTEQLPQDEIRILVDTSIARQVILPPSINFPVGNAKITVVDITGNAATNNITVSCFSVSDTINGAAVYLVNSNSESSRFEVLGANQYFTVNASGGGSGSTGVVIPYTAGGNLGMNRLVMLSAGRVVYFDPTSSSNWGKLVGFTLTSVTTGNTVFVKQSGVITNMGWGLTQDDLYFATTSGLITPTPPPTGIVVPVGVAVDNNNLQILSLEPIIAV